MSNQRVSVTLIGDVARQRFPLSTAGVLFTFGMISLLISPAYALEFCEENYQPDVTVTGIIDGFETGGSLEKNETAIYLKDEGCVKPIIIWNKKLPKNCKEGRKLTAFTELFQAVMLFPDKLSCK
jgi:hypothetical protein